MTHFWTFCSTRARSTVKLFSIQSAEKLTEFTACFNPGIQVRMKILSVLCYPNILFRILILTGFKGECSVIGHSLGSLILFDLLSGQNSDVKSEVNEESSESSGDNDLQIPRWEKDLSIEDVFSKLEISDHLPVFTDQGIGIAELETCSEDDLKEAGLPLGPRKRLLSYLNGRAKRKSGFDEFQASSVAKQVSYNVSISTHFQLP